MPTTRPGFIWSGTEWVAIGQEAIVNPFYYQATAPTTPSTGDIWIESDVDVPSVDSAQFLRWRKTMAGGETSLSGNDDSSLPLGYTPGYEQLYINGVLMVRGVDYTATDGTTVTGLTALTVNDVVEVFSTLARTVADVYTQTQSDARFVNRNVGGLNLVIPTGATNGTVGANGAVTIGSAVASVTVSGAFSSNYENYLIVISGGASSATSRLRLTLGATATGYYYAVTGRSWASGTATFAQAQNAAFWANCGTATTNSINGNVTLFSPFTAKATVMKAEAVGVSSVDEYQQGGGYLDNTTSYTAFTFTPNTGTLTGGTIRIYGYNNGA
jgi:hypothetical protein